MVVSCVNKNSEGLTCFEIAEIRNDYDLIRLFNNYRANENFKTKSEDDEDQSKSDGFSKFITHAPIPKPKNSKVGVKPISPKKRFLSNKNSSATLHQTPTHSKIEQEVKFV